MHHHFQCNKKKLCFFQELISQKKSMGKQYTLTRAQLKIHIVAMNNIYSQKVRATLRLNVNLRS
jgi:hypothetical protein